MAKISAKGVWEILKQSFNGFVDDKVTKLSGSLAYYTVFSMGPLLIVIIFLCSFFFGREAVEGTIYAQIEGFVGKDTALQMQQIIKNASLEGKNTGAAVIGFVMLLVGATTVFAEIQDSINSIWGIKPKPLKGIWLMVKNRLMSFSLIISLGFLLLVSLAVTTVVEGLNHRLRAAFPDMAVAIFYVLNLLITLMVITILFGLIFKVLPDARIRWKDVLAGSIVTAVLFMLGKFAISFYISKSDVGSTYGTAGSLVVLLLWVYYSSIILYFGAEFTKAYAIKYGAPIRPNPYAVTIQQVVVEAGKQSVQQNESKKSAVENAATKKLTNDQKRRTG
jgi:membrane protein